MHLERDSLCYCTLKFHCFRQFEQTWVQIFSSAVQLHVKIELVLSATTWKKQNCLHNLGAIMSFKTYSNI